MKIVLLFSVLFSSYVYGQNLVGYTFLSGSKQTPFQLTLHPFTTDGCTRYHEGPTEDSSKWEHCCVQHDLAYWLGGTKEERKQADIELRECVAATGHPVQAKIMYMGTRAGGGPLRHTTYRWGYGWNRVRDYRELTPQEREMAYSMYGENLEILKKEIHEKKYQIVVPESYKLRSPFEYTFCDEQIINHLTPLLDRPATVVSQKVTYENGIQTVRLDLDICEKPIKYYFSPKTTSATCKMDYAESHFYNKIENIEISKKCLERMKSEN